MNKTFIWGHRGMGFGDTQNTMRSFQRAIDMGCDGIKTEAQLLKDGNIVLSFNDKFKLNGKEVSVSELNLEQIKAIKIENDQSIPNLRELFEQFKKHDIKYNFDIRHPDIGVRIIEIAKEYNLTSQIEIAKPSIYQNSLPTIFSKIREFDKEITLINSVSLKVSDIQPKDLELQYMKDLNVQVINVNYHFANMDLFKTIVENGFKFYIWGVLFKRDMIKFLKMHYKKRNIDGMYSNFPIRLLHLRDRIQNN